MKTVKQMLREQGRGEAFSVLPQQSVLSAAQFMKFNNVGAVAVRRNNVLLGIVSERDMVNKVLGPGLDPRDIAVSEIMSNRLITVSPEDDLRECLGKMKRNQCRHLPVVQDGSLIGMISLRDVLGVDEEELMDSYLWDREARQETI